MICLFNTERLFVQSWLCAISMGAALFLASELRAQSPNMCSSGTIFPSSACYRSLCNSVDATGSISNDGCGSCTTSNATRWVNPVVGVRFESSQRPSEVSSAEWSTIVNNVTNQWSSVPGSNLSVQNLGSGSRDPGLQDGQNVLLWINSQSEYISLLGAGGLGALGVTLSSIDLCSRDITDADIVMNAVPGAVQLPWSADRDDCDRFQDRCTSAKAVLLHEMGHLVGLGHPCPDDSCKNWSVMAASGGRGDPEELRISDIAGIEAIYPGSGSGAGSACSSNGDCPSPLICGFSDGLRYCTSLCSSDSDCADGFECDEAGSGECVFLGTIVPSVGEACVPPYYECENDAVCLGDESSALCYERCNPNGSNTCPASFECVDIGQEASVFGVCINPNGEQAPGEYCDSEFRCVEGATCIPEVNGASSGTCRAACNPQSGVGCSAFESCIYFNNDSCTQSNTSACFDGCDNNGYCEDSSFCYPGGPGQEGDTCTGVFGCDVGLACIQESVAISRCYARCDHSWTCPDTRQTCERFMGTVNPSVVVGAVCTPRTSQLEPADSEPADPTSSDNTSTDNSGVPADPTFDQDGQDPASNPQGPTDPVNVSDESNTSDTSGALSLSGGGLLTQSCSSSETSGSLGPSTYTLFALPVFLRRRRKKSDLLGT